MWSRCGERPSLYLFDSVERHDGGIKQGKPSRQYGVLVRWSEYVERDIPRQKSFVMLIDLTLELNDKDRPVLTPQASKDRLFSRVSVANGNTEK